jgi:SAM-dependent methyltransferase
MTVVDVGAGANPHPDADVTVDQRRCADRQADLNDEWPLATASCDRVIARHVVEHLADPEHAFAEAGRVLKPGGTFEVWVPLGHDAAADPTHRWTWTWKTPRYYCSERDPGWGPDVPFRLTCREPRDLRFAGPLADVSPLLQWASRRWPAWACYRAFDGELYCRFRRQQ